MRIKGIVSHIGQAVLEGGLIAALVIGLAVGTTFAAKGGGHGGGGSTTTGSGSCTVNPDPATVGADYTINGSGLGANRFVNVLISDSVQTTSWNLASDANGNLTLTWHSYWSGTSKVTFQTTGTKPAYLGGCTFQVS